MASRSTSLLISKPDRFESVFAEDEAKRPSAITRTYAGLSDFLRLLRRRRRIMVLTIAAITITTIVVLARATPIYESTTTVLVKPLQEQQRVDMLQQGDTPIAVAPNESARVDTKVRLLQSRALARSVAKSADLQDVEEFAAAKIEEPNILQRIGAWISPAPPADDLRSPDLSEKDAAAQEEQRELEKVTDNFIQHLTVARLGDSNLIDVTVRSQSPRRAALLSNRIPQTYIKGLTEAQDDADQENQKWLGERIAELGRQLTAAETAIAEYRRTHGIVAESPAEMQQSQLTQASIALAQARAERAAVSNQQIGRGNAIRASSALLDNLRAQEATIARRISELTPLYGNNYPEMRANVSQLDEIRRRIAVETARAQTAAQQEAAALTAGATGREAVLAREAAIVGGQATRSRFSSVGLQRLEREAEATRAQYVSMLSRFKQEGERQSNKADISIVSRAWLPETPSFPKTSQILVVSLIAAVAFSLILALAAEAVDDRLRNADQVRRLLNLPTLAMVPELPDKLSGLPATEMITHRPKSLFSESMRNLVIELETRRTHPGAQVVVVTSPVPDDGKSTISASLAAAAASLGRRAIVVDLDLRRAGSDADGADDGGADLIAFLSNQANVDELLPDTEHGFSTISIRQKVTDPGGLLASPRLRALLDELRKRFDLVALNAPPIIPVRDAKTLSGIADGTILVIRWGVTDPSAAATAVDIFGGGLMGVVLNGVDYNAHARRAYGDAIDHASRYGGEYFQLENAPAGRLRLNWRGI